MNPVELREIKNIAEYELERKTYPKYQAEQSLTAQQLEELAQDFL
jgi:hypothetical protein